MANSDRPILYTPRSIVALERSVLTLVARFGRPLRTLGLRAFGMSDRILRMHLGSMGSIQDAGSNAAVSTRSRQSFLEAPSDFAFPWYEEDARIDELRRLNELEGRLEASVRASALPSKSLAQLAAQPTPAERGAGIERTTLSGDLARAAEVKEFVALAGKLASSASPAVEEAFARSEAKPATATSEATPTSEAKPATATSEATPATATNEATPVAQRTEAALPELRVFEMLRQLVASDRHTHQTAGEPTAQPAAARSVARQPSMFHRALDHVTWADHQLTGRKEVPLSPAEGFVYTAPHEQPVIAAPASRSASPLGLQAGLDTRMAPAPAPVATPDAVATPSATSVASAPRSLPSSAAESLTERVRETVAPLERETRGYQDKLADAGERLTTIVAPLSDVVASTPARVAASPVQSTPSAPVAPSISPPAESAVRTDAAARVQSESMDPSRAATSTASVAPTRAEAGTARIAVPSREVSFAGGGDVSLPGFRDYGLVSSSAASPQILRFVDQLVGARAARDTRVRALDEARSPLAAVATSSVRLPIGVALRGSTSAPAVDPAAVPLHAAQAPSLAYVSGEERAAVPVTVPPPPQSQRVSDDLRPGSLGTRMEQLAGILGIRAANLSIDILDTDRFLAALDRTSPMPAAGTAPGTSTTSVAPGASYEERITTPGSTAASAASTDRRAPVDDSSLEAEASSGEAGDVLPDGEPAPRKSTGQPYESLGMIEPVLVSPDIVVDQPPVVARPRIEAAPPVVAARPVVAPAPIERADRPQAATTVSPAVETRTPSAPQATNAVASPVRVEAPAAVQPSTAVTRAAAIESAINRRLDAVWALSRVFPGSAPSLVTALANDITSGVGAFDAPPAMVLRDRLTNLVMLRGALLDVPAAAGATLAASSRPSLATIDTTVSRSSLVGNVSPAYFAPSTTSAQVPIESLVTAPSAVALRTPSAIDTPPHIAAAAPAEARAAAFRTAGVIGLANTRGLGIGPIDPTFLIETSTQRLSLSQGVPTMSLPSVSATVDQLAERRSARQDEVARQSGIAPVASLPVSPSGSRTSQASSSSLVSSSAAEQATVPSANAGGSSSAIMPSFSSSSYVPSSFGATLPALPSDVPLPSLGSGERVWLIAMGRPEALAAAAAGRPVSLQAGSAPGRNFIVVRAEEERRDAGAAGRDGRSPAADAEIRREVKAPTILQSSTFVQQLRAHGYELPATVIAAMSGATAAESGYPAWGGITPVQIAAQRQAVAGDAAGRSRDSSAQNMGFSASGAGASGGFTGAGTMSGFAGSVSGGSIPMGIAGGVVTAPRGSATSTSLNAAFAYQGSLTVVRGIDFPRTGSASDSPAGTRDGRSSSASAVAAAAAPFLQLVSPTPSVAGKPTTDASASIVAAASRAGLNASTNGSGGSGISLSDLTLITTASATRQIAAASRAQQPRQRHRMVDGPKKTPGKGVQSVKMTPEQEQREIDELARRVLSEVDVLLAMARERTGDDWSR